MLILSPEDVHPCALQHPGSLPLFGFRYQRWHFYLEGNERLPEAEAVTRCRIWIENPEHPQVFKVLYCDGNEYRVAVHTPDLTPMSWQNGLSSLCETMRTSGQLVADHRWRLRNFEKSFIGSEAVSWLCQNLGISRVEAVQLGRECQQAGLLAHVLGEQEFADAPYYYRFRLDGQPEERMLPPVPPVLGQQTQEDFTFQLT